MQTGLFRTAVWGTKWNQMKSGGKKEKRRRDNLLKPLSLIITFLSKWQGVLWHWLGKGFLVSGFAFVRILKLLMHRKGGMGSGSRNILKLQFFAVFPLCSSFLYLAQPLSWQAEGEKSPRGLKLCRSPFQGEKQQVWPLAQSRNSRDPHKPACHLARYLLLSCDLCAGIESFRLIVCLGYLQPETSVLQGVFWNSTDFTATLCYYIVRKTRGWNTVIFIVAVLCSTICQQQKRMYSKDFLQTCRGIQATNFKFMLEAIILNAITKVW